MEYWLNNQLDNQGYRFNIDEEDPEEAYGNLVRCKKSFLVDVRSQAEWSFVGIPYSLEMKNDTIFCEWASFPEMIKNPNFVEECVRKVNLEKTKILYFLCRSGARSLQAASEVKNLIHHSYKKFSDITCINIRYGFEGDLSKDFKRATLNGWKYSNLPWKQL